MKPAGCCPALIRTYVSCLDCRVCPEAWHPPMGIGPWHARAHIVECQNEFGARTLDGSCCSFGDNIEHLWADVRPYSYIMKRLTAAGRLDLLLMLTRHDSECVPATQARSSCRFAVYMNKINDRQCIEVVGGGAQVRDRGRKKEAGLPQLLDLSPARSAGDPAAQKCGCQPAAGGDGGFGSSCCHCNGGYSGTGSASQGARAGEAVSVRRPCPRQLPIRPCLAFCSL